MRAYLKLLVLGVCFLATSQTAQPQEKAKKGIEGYWFGTLNIGTVKLQYGFNITKNDKGSLKATFDCLEGEEKDVSIDEVDFSGARLNLRLKSRKAEFNGELNAAGKEIVGKWNQRGKSLDLTLKRTDRAAVIVEAKRPQHPKKPYPYAEEEVAYAYVNKMVGVKLAGTLTMPRGDGPFPAVILITGSGPQDRDQTLFEHKPFLVLADHLTRQGIAVLRVDDRDTGESTGDFKTATTEDFAQDVAAGVGFLNGRKDIHSQRIGLLGHSEGGMIAPMVAAQSKDVAFIVLFAGPGVSGEDILARQTRLLLARSGENEEAIKRHLDIQRQLFAILKTEKDDKVAAQKIRELPRKEEKKPSDAKKMDPEFSKDGADVPVQCAWFRFFISFDPRTALAKVRCPVLAINGERDLQVDPRQNLPAIGAALIEAGNKDYTIKEFPKLNHFFQTCQTGLPSEYGEIEETIAPAVLDFVADWIKQRCQ